MDWDTAAQAAHRIGASLSELSLPLHRLAIVQVFHYTMKRGWRVSSHRHSYHEVSLILAGRARDESAAGRRQILTPGSVFVNGAHQNHAWSSPYGQCHRLVVCFNADPPVRLQRPDRWPCWPEMVDHAWAMLLLAHEQQPGWLDRVAARMAVLLTQVLTLNESVEPAAPPMRPSREKLADQVDAFLEDHLAHTITLGEIASSLRVSVRLLTERYQQQRGQSIGQRLATLRIEQAAHLLRETDYSLQAIAEQVGLNQSAYLCRLFRRHLRTTPGLYRKKYLNPKAG